MRTNCTHNSNPSPISETRQQGLADPATAVGNLLQFTRNAETSNNVVQRVQAPICPALLHAMSPQQRPTHKPLKSPL